MHHRRPFAFPTLLVPTLLPASPALAAMDVLREPPGRIVEKTFGKYPVENRKR